VALRDINLIPPDVVESRLGRRHLCLWAGCLVLSVGLLFSLSLIHTYTLKMRRQSIATLNDIPGQLITKSEVLKVLQSDLEKLDQQRSALTAIRSKSRPVSQVIYELSRNMNDETWLSQLTMDTDEGPERVARLVLTGISTSNEYLGEFLKQLSQERAFKGVALNFASEVEKEGSAPKTPVSKSRIRFQIAFQVGGG
jgi:Tfp pilus assembly protein PilN